MSKSSLFGENKSNLEKIFVGSLKKLNFKKLGKPKKFEKLFVVGPRSHFFIFFGGKK